MKFQFFVFLFQRNGISIVEWKNDWQTNKKHQRKPFVHWSRWAPGKYFISSLFIHWNFHICESMEKIQSLSNYYHKQMKYTVFFSTDFLLFVPCNQMTHANKLAKHHLSGFSEVRQPWLGHKKKQVWMNQENGKKGAEWWQEKKIQIVMSF